MAKQPSLSKQLTDAGSDVGRPWESIGECPAEPILSRRCSTAFAASLLPARMVSRGMLRDAIALVVNRDLRLVKPGSQGGVDMATDLSEGWPSVAVETKRHSDGKSLRLDQLKAKLFDAVQQRPKLDLIVFGALALRELRSLALGINLNNDGRTTANPATFRHAL